MNFDFFANYEEAEIWYSEIAERFFIFHYATFLQLPCLEREDGKKLITKHPSEVEVEIQGHFPLVFIGKL